jgi:hypothetical protein
MGEGLRYDTVHLSSPRVSSWVRVAEFLVLCVCFVDHCLSFFPFSFLAIYQFLLSLV